MRLVRAALPVLAVATVAGIALRAGPVRLAPTAALTLCAAGERIVYSCPFARGTGSVCMGANSLHYRFGHPGHVDIDIANARDWGNVHTGGAVGGGGGSEDHIRFTNGQTHYVVFAGEMGSLTDHPGRRYSGIAIVRGADGLHPLATLECHGGATIARDGLAGALSNLKPGPDEDSEGGPFDIMF